MTKPVAFHLELTIEALARCTRRTRALLREVAKRVAVEVARPKRKG